MKFSDEEFKYLFERERITADITSRLYRKRLQNVYKGKITGRRRSEGKQIVIHRYKKAIWRFNEMVEEGRFKNAFRDSDLSDLAIVTVHNYDEKPLFEESLDYFGITDYTVLGHGDEWKMTHKYLYLLEFIEGCNKPYVMFCDARDTVFIDDPAKIVPIFKEFGCEVLFNSTMSARGIFKSYESALPLYWWTRIIAGMGWRKRYPNAGAFIGRKDVVKEIAEIILFYCERMGCRYAPNSDQDVLRSIYPWYWPRMTIDYYNKIFYRN
jgi:hypothetical protein